MKEGQVLLNLVLGYQSTFKDFFYILTEKASYLPHEEHEGRRKHLFLECVFTDHTC